MNRLIKSETKSIDGKTSIDFVFYNDNYEIYKAASIPNSNLLQDLYSIIYEDFDEDYAINKLLKCSTSCDKIDINDVDIESISNDYIKQISELSKYGMVKYINYYRQLMINTKLLRREKNLNNILR